VVYITVSDRPAKYWEVLAELNGQVGNGRVVTAASLFGAGEASSTTERMEIFYRQLGKALSPGDALVVLPGEAGTVGTGVWNTMVIARSRGADILIVTSAGHLRHHDQVSIELLPADRPYGELVRSWARFHWRQPRTTPKLEWAMLPRDRPARSAPSPAPQDRKAEAEAQEAAVRGAARTPKALARGLAALARGRAARAAADASRERALGEGAGEREANAAAALANAEVMGKPLEDFMTEEQRGWMTQPAAAPPRPKPKAIENAKATSPLDQVAARLELSTGEFKAFKQAANPKARQRTLASLLRGREAKAAAEAVRSEMEASKEAPELVVQAAGAASARVFGQALEPYLEIAGRELRISSEPPPA